MSRKFVLLVVIGQLLWHTLLAQEFSFYEAVDSLNRFSAYDEIIKLENNLSPGLADNADTTTANLFYYFGDAFLQSGNYNRGIEYFQKEKEVRRRLSSVDPSGFSNMMYALTQTYFENGDRRKAHDNGLEQLAFDEKSFGSNSSEYLYSILLFTDIILQDEQFLKAERILMNAYRSCPRDHDLRGLLSGKLGLVYSSTGRYKKSNVFFEESLNQISKVFGEVSVEYQLTLANYGYALLLQGKYDTAEEHLASAIEAIRTKGMEGNESTYYALVNNLSLALQQMGQYDASEKGYKEILEYDSITSGTQRIDYAITLSNRGVLLSDQKKFFVAETILRQCLNILEMKNAKTSLYYARTLNILAKVYQASRRPQMAIPLLEESLKIFSTSVGKSSHEYATALYILGSAYLEIGNGRALKTFEECKRLRAKIFGRSHPLYAQVLEKIALYQWQKKSHKKAEILWDAVFQNYYGQIDNYFPALTEEEKANFYFNKLRPSLDAYTTWVLSNEGNRISNLGDLYTNILNTKGLILFATEKVKRKIYESSDTSLIHLFEEWEEQKEMLAYLFGQTQNTKTTDSLLKVSNDLEKELSRRSVYFGNQIIRPRFSWTDIRNRLMPGEAAIEMIRYHHFNKDSAFQTDEVRYAALILTANSQQGPEVVMFENGKELEGRLLTFYRNGIYFKLEDTRSYTNFWKPLGLKLQNLGIQKVYFSPDGAYNVIALNSLKNPDTKKFLIEEMDVKTMTATRDLVDKRIDNNSGSGFLLLGFPSFKVAETVESDSGKEVRTKNLSRSMRGSLTRFLRGGGSISELPGTQAEVMEIRSMLDTANTVTFLAEDANEENIKSVKGPKVLHVATHGYFMEDGGISGFKPPNPLLSSGLILAGASNFILSGENPLHPEEDGILSAYEAMNMDLEGTELVILSACETGLGYQRNGEGVYGLRRALYIAGAHSIVMSLWSVDDQATRELMTTFYKDWKRSGNVHSAFREAQLATLKKFPDPYYWAAFVVVGE